MKTMFFGWKRRALVIAVISLACAGNAWQSQEDALARIHAQEDREFQTAANNWMKVPVDVRTQTDPVSSEDRQARDGYWDKRIGASAPLSDPNAQGHPMPTGDAIANAPEIGDLADGVMVIGKFETYRTVLSASRHSVYTEIGLRIEHVFGHPNPTIRQGQLIDLVRPGGTIIAPWGKTLSYNIRPEQMGLQPQHTYLVRLGYNASGKFYSGGYRTGELWDLTDGTVKPGNSLQKYRAEHGMSEINGLSVDALIQLLDAKYKKYYEGGR